MKTVTWTPSLKQEQAFGILNDKITNEVLYGGGA